MFYPILEIGIHSCGPDTSRYYLELRFSVPSDETAKDIRYMQGQDKDLNGARTVQFDLRDLNAIDPANPAYGLRLTRGFFRDSRVRSLFKQAETRAQAMGRPLRISLVVNPSAIALHRLRWETLRHPDCIDWDSGDLKIINEANDSLLVASNDVCFSRYLYCQDSRPLRSLRSTWLNSLVIISNPTDVEGNTPGGTPLRAINVAGEAERARTVLKGRSTPIFIGENSRGATLKAIATELRNKDKEDTAYDIVYLVCHGHSRDGMTRLWLQNEEGASDVVKGSDLERELNDLQYPPRLVILAACQSIGTDGEEESEDNGILSTLGPRLAESGIPAVIAMQANVTMTSIAQFMPRFFEVLLQEGRVDEAVMQARYQIRERRDSWVPVLFTSLKNGFLWYSPQFKDSAGNDFDGWPSIRKALEHGYCTPVLGPGLLNKYIGPQRELARRWAEQYFCPMSPHMWEDLPQVAQYVESMGGNPRGIEFQEYWHAELLKRHEHHLPPQALEELSVIPKGIRGAALETVDKLLEETGKVVRYEDQLEPHNVLARLPCSVYLTTNPDDLLEGAFKKPKRIPSVAVCPWKGSMATSRAAYTGSPTPYTPLVYHLYGRLEEPGSLVSTQDDYFNYLINTSLNRDTLPTCVQESFTDSTLLFLGFQVEDWNFRVLLNSILSFGGAQNQQHYPHFTVQIDPERGGFSNPARARKYLEKYFGAAGGRKREAAIFWGSVEDFMEQLYKQVSDLMI